MQSDKRPENMERITTPALAEAFIEEQVKKLRAQIGDKKVLLLFPAELTPPSSPPFLSKPSGSSLSAST